jgi:hypothetical protein
MPEAIGKPNFGANKDSAIELEKVPLIGSADDVVVVKNSFRRTDAVDKCAAQVSGIRAACEAEYRLLEIGLRRQLERGEKVGERVVGRLVTNFRGSGRCRIGRRLPIDRHVSRPARCGSHQSERDRKDYENTLKPQNHISPRVA